ncbi:hypothetical protein MRB53_041040 [Persea americana]|nr:hypothetical protein MRB53_041040 [Persea americana]
MSGQVNELNGYSHPSELASDWKAKHELDAQYWRRSKHNRSLEELDLLTPVSLSGRLGQGIVPGEMWSDEIDSTSSFRHGRDAFGQVYRTSRIRRCHWIELE